MITPVMMEGDSFFHSWTLSRFLYPKQFLALTGDQTMLQETVQRLSDLDVNAPLVIGNEEHRFIVAE